MFEMVIVWDMMLLLLLLLLLGEFSRVREGGTVTVSVMGMDNISA